MKNFKFFMIYCYRSTYFLEELDEDVCTLPKDSGPCEGTRVYWYYNHEKTKCRKFVYGGCGGNKNRFHSQSECIANCYSELMIKGT